MLSFLLPLLVFGSDNKPGALELMLLECVKKRPYVFKLERCVGFHEYPPVRGLLTDTG
jgi:hypothetical protein